ncbi:serine/threonine-protein kinase [Nocardia nepalensis]|uniref:serine/threonine-protein kinase n=1 Tax=Nocardia nepalensis TaxID=3375448 RepID=UPI003B674746
MSRTWAFKPGDVFAGYEIVKTLGEGGASVVYLATDRALQRQIALKLLKTEFHDRESLVRFTREATIAARLDHPNIVTVYNIGGEDGQPWIAMRYVDGTDAYAVVRNGPIPPGRAVWIISETAEALDYAHSQGVLHRDIKPANIMLSRMTDNQPERVMLADFGIAKASDELGALTQTGTVIGTIQYAAPEQLLSYQLDQRVDVYALGCTLYHLLTGEVPYSGSMGQQIAGHLHGEIPRPSLHPAAQAIGVPEDLDTVIERALAKNRDDRYSTCGELADAARAALNSATTVVWDGTPMPATPATTHVPFEQAPTQIPYGQPPPETAIQPPATAWPSGTTYEGDRTGQRIGDRYYLLERMARGLSGDLYRAYDPMRGKLVAVKIIGTNNPDMHSRLERAGRVWLNIEQHHNVVRVFDVQKAYRHEPAYIVSEIVDGTDLGTLSAQRDLSLEQIIWIVMQICDGLKHIHGAGVVHREIKPSNILVSGADLHVTLLDSGIARHENPAVDLFTKTGDLVGDLAYAAPEQIAGHRFGQRADIYAVAAILYELITESKLPLALPADWQPDTAILDDLPERLRSALERGLAKKPRHRYASIGELHDQLAPLSKRQPLSEGAVVVALHGIRTQAAWQRAFSEVAGRVGMGAHADRWNFGYFSVLRFLMPWARLAKVRWFRETYQQEFDDAPVTGQKQPSIVAHSFGTYILGNALLRYPYLRFNKVLLCGSILPTRFPWDLIIERGQVQAVRNEYGSEDVWTRGVGWFVPGTGPSGVVGFSAKHARFEQEHFLFAHSEYFERGHMVSRWLPFLNAHIDERPARETSIAPPKTDGRPWGLYIVYALLVLTSALSMTAIGIWS